MSDPPVAIHRLDPSKNPLLISIFDACETVKTLLERDEGFNAEVVNNAKAFLMMRLDKARRRALPPSAPRIRRLFGGLFSA